MAKTIDEAPINPNDAEDFKLPSDGVHNANLSGVEFGQTKAGDREQFIVTITLSEDDPDAPNLPMKLYVGWATEEDKSIMWGSRTAYGSKIKSLKDLMTAFGGPEDLYVNKAKTVVEQKQMLTAFLLDKTGQPVKVKTKQELRTEKDVHGNRVPVDPPELQANVKNLLPA